jgi:hypothetical protein
MIAGKDDDRVVGEAELVESREQPADQPGKRESQMHGGKRLL